MMQVRQPGLYSQYMKILSAKNEVYAPRMLKCPQDIGARLFADTSGPRGVLNWHSLQICEHFQYVDGLYLGSKPGSMNVARSGYIVVSRDSLEFRLAQWTGIGWIFAVANWKMG
jgi:hypothetical protein